jgi:hypothetical protein
MKRMCIDDILANTLHNTLHILGFFVAFGGLSIALLLIGLHLRKKRAWRSYGWYALISTCLPA